MASTVDMEVENLLGVDAGNQEQSNGTACARKVRQVACSGTVLGCEMILLGLAILWYSVQPTVETRVGGVAELVGSQFKCCGRGNGNTQGLCIPGDPNGRCCSTETALLCGAGSECYVNKGGHPYCCGIGTSGCSDVCVDAITRSWTLRTGGFCNEVAPRGFNVDGTVLWVNAPWDASNLRYDLDGTQDIRFDNPPIQIGGGDVTFRATITPRVNGTVGRSNGTDTLPGVLYARFNIVDQTTVSGYAIVFADDVSSTRNTAILIFAENATFGPGPPAGIQLATANISDIWQANVPVSFTASRQGNNIFVYINDSPVPVRFAEFSSARPPNVDAGLQVPLLVSPRFIPGMPLLVGPRFIPGMPHQSMDMDAFIADMSIASSARVP